MKNLIFAVLLLFCGATVCAQTTTKEQRKAFIQDRENVQKMAAAALGDKVEKIAKKSAKDYKKEGWKPFPGGLPLYNQLVDYYTKTSEQDGNFPKYVTGEGIAIGGSMNAAQMNAKAVAIGNVSENLGSEVTKLTNTAVINKTINESEANSINEATAKTKIITQQKLKNLKPGLSMYRQKDGKTEVSIVLLYDGMDARATIISELEKDNKKLADKFANITK